MNHVVLSCTSLSKKKIFLEEWSIKLLEVERELYSKEPNYCSNHLMPCFLLLKTCTRHYSSSLPHTYVSLLTNICAGYWKLILSGCTCTMPFIMITACMTSPCQPHGRYLRFNFPSGPHSLLRNKYKATYNLIRD